MKQSTKLRSRYKELARGFHFHVAEVSDTQRDQFLGSAEAWEVLAGVLLSSRSGDHAELSRLPKLMRRYDDFFFWKAATELIGYSGNWHFIDQFFQGFQSDKDDRGVQYFLAISLANSCGLWAVEPLLTLHASAVEEEPRYQIERHLSYLLEEENDMIWIGAEEKAVISDTDDEDIDVFKVVDFESFAKEVRSAVDEVIESVGSADKPVYEGRLLDVAEIARRLHHRLTSEDEAVGRIYRERMLFEASTGIDCSDFYDKNGGLQYLQAAAIIENFLESDAVDRFEPGLRYFFGHPIPD